MEGTYLPGSFLASIPEAEGDALVALGQRRSWARGELLVRAGDTADTAIVLLSGVTKIHTQARDGTEVVLSLCGPGDLLGELTAVRASRRSASATVIEPVGAAVLTIPQVRAFLAAHPQATLALLDLAMTRLHRADAHRLEFAAADTLGRVARRLLELAERFGIGRPDGSCEVSLALTQEDLAAWSASSRESTARALRALRQLGLIETQRLRLTIRDLERLRAQVAQL